MKVYVVYEKNRCEYGCQHLQGVFTTLENANAFIDLQDPIYRFDYEIVEQLLNQVLA